MGKNVKYGLFSYNTDNIGDEIQSIAARRFLPRIDYYIDRDNIDGFKSSKNEEVKLIMNGWYSHRPDTFPPKNPSLRPLLISMYISDHVKEEFGDGDSKKFFNRFGPVGARNTDTKEYFDEKGIKSYFSGCLTLTIQRSPKIKKRDFVLAVDVPDEALVTLKRVSKYPVVEMGAMITTEDMSTSERFSLAELYLHLYQSARCVVTTRLHATLPSLALETPVLNLEKEGYEPGRFAGLRELSHHATARAYAENPDIYDVNSPPMNPTKYLKLRTQLIEACEKFTGYVNNDGFLSSGDDDEVFFRLTTLQPILTGLRSRYELNYTGKVLDDRVDMLNVSVESAKAAEVLKMELAEVKQRYYDVIGSRSWRILTKARQVKGGWRRNPRL